MTLRKIDKMVKTPDNSYLVFLNVRSLYTSNSEGIKATITSLENFLRRAVAAKVITTFLSLMLTLNNFAFNCKNYLYIKGYTITAWKVSKYGNFSVPYFPVFGLYTSNSVFSPNIGKYGPNKLRIWTLFTQCMGNIYALAYANIFMVHLCIQFPEPIAKNLFFRQI